MILSDIPPDYVLNMPVEGGLPVCESKPEWWFLKRVEANGLLEVVVVVVNEDRATRSIREEARLHSGIICIPVEYPE